MDSDIRKESFFDKFCRRFLNAFTLIVGLVLLILTAFFRSNYLRAFFFTVEFSSTGGDIQLQVIYSAALLCCTALLSLSCTPSTNAWIVTLSVMACNSGLVITNVVQYTSHYDMSKSVFQFDGFLITWLLTLFLSTVLAAVCTALAARYQRDVVLTTLLLRKQWADGQAGLVTSHLISNKAASVTSAPISAAPIYPDLTATNDIVTEPTADDHVGRSIPANIRPASIEATMDHGTDPSLRRPVSLVGRDGEFSTPSTFM